MKNSILFRTVVLVAVVLLQFANEANAQSFKLSNSTSSTYRMRVMNNGHWSEYVQALPGSQVTAASGVTRGDHNVEIDVYENGQWRTVVTERRGSRAFTRIAELTENQRGEQYLGWKDEVPIIRNTIPSKYFGPVADVAGRVYDLNKSSVKYAKKAVKWIF